MKKSMWYVYFLRSKTHDFTYVGSTGSLQNRVEQHNAGESPATKHYAPFKLVTFIAVQTKDQAEELERYFKSGSGMAFMRKRLLPKE